MPKLVHNHKLIFYRKTPPLTTNRNTEKTIYTQNITNHEDNFLLDFANILQM